MIAGLVCAADFARRGREPAAADFILQYADWVVAHLEEWTVTTAGELVAGCPRHYVRINPTDAANPDPHADPNRTVLAIANDGGEYPARNVVGGDFLHLVRLGIRAADDPLIRDSLTVAGAGLAPLQSRWLRAEGRRQSVRRDGHRPRVADFDGRARALRTRRRA